MKRMIFFVLGCLSVALGTIGVFLPILPTVPFYLAAAYFWLNSSQKMHDKFVQTSLYKKYVKEMVMEKKMTRGQRHKILLVLFALLAIPFIMVPNTIMRLGLASIFIGHAIFFAVYFPKKEKKEKNKAIERVDIYD